MCAPLPFTVFLCLFASMAVKLFIRNILKITGRTLSVGPKEQAYYFFWIKMCVKYKLKKKKKAIAYVLFFFWSSDFSAFPVA